MNKRALTLIATVPVALFALAGCGNPSSSSSTAATVPSTLATATSTPVSAGMMHNDADSAFASAMVAHHEQAVAMAKLAATNATDSRVKDLAARIEAAQGPEIMMMNGWMSQWNAPSPGESNGMGGMSHMGGTATAGVMNGMDGLMSDSDMSALAADTGATFDKAFLTMMFAHHEGALTMAEAELKSGSNSDAMALAKAIIAAQTKEIAEMKAILAGN